MTTFFHAIAAMFEALFSVLPYVGRIVNILFIAAGAIGTFIWIRHMVNTQENEKGFNQ